MAEHITKEGKNYIIRKAAEEDAANIIEYSKTMFASTDQVLTELDEYTITYEIEKIWIKSLNENQNALCLVAESNQEIIGLLFFTPNQKKKIRHTGEFGISVHPDFQNVGIGREMISTLIRWAENNAQIEKLILTVFETNKNAVALYENLGFKREGRFVKAVKQRSGQYVDVIQMYIETVK